ncbi:hypothetical protein BC629DRAFT_452642 [Irpex lacteus]|nr:hypothetical protein BC629DRAFT_452642 [Irpex lacteus]
MEVLRKDGNAIITDSLAASNASAYIPHSAQAKPHGNFTISYLTAMADWPEWPGACLVSCWALGAGNMYRVSALSEPNHILLYHAQQH